MVEAKDLDVKRPLSVAAGKERKFKAVIFDMGGVLVKFKKAESYAQLVARARADKAVAQALREWDMGVTSAEELRELFADLMPNMPVLNVEEVAQVENVSLLDECMLAVVSQLKEAGLKVAILTNNGFWSRAKRRTVMISDVSMFDVVIESCLVGLRKPDPRIFLKAAELLGVCPEECVFLDDTEGHCRGARAIGMTAIHVANCESKPAIKRLGSVLQLPLSTVRHRISMVDNGKRETFIWAYSPQSQRREGAGGGPQQQNGNGLAREAAEEEPEELFWW